MTMTRIGKPATVAITGASGFLGQGLLRRLASTGSYKIVGIDVRESSFRARELELHLLDLTTSDLRPLLEGVDCVVHLAGVHALPDEELMTRVNVIGTRRVLEAAGAVGVSKIVLVSSATAYGAWANNPIPLDENAPLRPNPGFLFGVHKAEAERLLAEWGLDHPEAVTTVLRPAFVLGPNADHAVARYVRSGMRLALGGASAPVQFVHEDDAVSAIALAVERDLPGVYNVAAEGWLDRDELMVLLGRRPRLTLGPQLLGRLLGRLWPARMASLPPSAVPYLAHPWVIAVDRLKGEGWAPEHTNEEAVRAGVGGQDTSSLAVAVAVGAGLAVLGVVAVRGVRASRRRGSG